MINRHELLNLLKDTIAFDTQNPPGNDLVLAEFIANYLSDAPCHVEVQDLGNGIGNVIAVIKGESSDNALMLNGHLDTVPYGSLDCWSSPPGVLTERGGRAFARGVADMKSGLCASLYAFKLIALSGKKPRRDIIFIGTGDEEAGGVGARAIVNTEWLDNVGSIIIGEPTGNHLGICTKGAIWLKIEITGKTSHAAYPEQGINAITEALAFTEIIKDLMKSSCEHELLGHATCTLTQIQAGIKVNIVPDKCTAWLDIRTLPGFCHDDLLRQISKASKERESSMPGLGIEIETVNNRMPVSSDFDCDIACLLAKIYREVTGTGMESVGAAYFTDASIFLDGRKIDAVFFGPGESNEAHKPNESIDIAKYELSAKVYLKLLENTITKQ